MTQKDFQSFKTLKEQLDKEIEELFDYIKENYNDVLEYGEDSFFNRYSYSIEDDEICIEYRDFWSDDIYLADIYIHINDFLTNPTGWVDNWAKNERDKRKQEEERKKQKNEEREKEELKRLKEKYEK